MIIDSEGNEITPPKIPFGVAATWAISFVFLLVGLAAAVAFALWLALLLIPAGIIAAGLASVIYRIKLARWRKSLVVRS